MIRNLILGWSDSREHKWSDSRERRSLDGNHTTFRREFNAPLVPPPPRRRDPHGDTRAVVEVRAVRPWGPIPRGPVLELRSLGFPEDEAFLLRLRAGLDAIDVPYRLVAPGE